MKKIFELDRRIIFIFIAFAVAIPLVFPLRIPIVVDKKDSKAVYASFEFIDSLPEGSVILVSFDFDPAAAPELYPMGKAIIEHAFSKNIDVITVALWPQGVRFAENALNEGAAVYERERWKHFVNLGYKSGGVVAIDNIIGDIKKTCPRDLSGKNAKDIELLKNVNYNLDKVAVIVTLSAGDPGVIGWVQIGKDKYGKNIIAGCTAVSAPAYSPYFNSGQLNGLIGGMAGAAEYEQLIKSPGMASSGMDAQSIAHVCIIAFILFGNLAYIVEKRGKKNG
ncbi:hypothetical protein JW890_08595 [candidate division WOR-3 bacterium]|nr:hypothetical protein [candidate division WOR-3 bacterium]